MANGLTPLSKEDPLLRAKCKKVTLKELRSPIFQKIVDDMLDVVYGRSNKGTKRNERRPMTVGLSANQVGINKRISVVDFAIVNNNVNDIHVLINPKIIKKSKAKFAHREGCVNLPEIWGMIERHQIVTVEALDRSGNKITVEAKDWLSVLLQHEIDHLNGYMFIDHLKDPSKAHFVKGDEMETYRGKEEKWDKHIDVSELIRKKSKK